MQVKSVTKINIDLKNSADEKANSEETKNVKEKKIENQPEAIFAESPNFFI